MIAQGRSFIAETVFSHPSKLDLISLVATCDALKLAHEDFAYDNSSARAAYRVVAHLEGGRLLGTPEWPDWSELGDFLR